MIFHQPENSLTNYRFNAVTYTDTVWDSHFHKNMELIWVLEGAVSCTVGGRSFRLEKGDAGLCLPYDIHKYVPEADTVYWVLVFSEDFVHAFAKQITGKTGDGFAFRLPPDTEAYLKARLLENPAPSVFTLKSCLYGVCEAYLEAVPLTDKSKGKGETVSVIVDYIQKNYTQRISLRDLANILGYDYNYMSRCFKHFFAMTFTNFINIYRLEAAIRLLRETKKDITQIAYESGFQSVRSFQSFFKKAMDTSPARYRAAEVSASPKA